MTTLEDLKTEKETLEMKIRANEELLKSIQDTIYWDKKRVKLIDSQIKVTPATQTPVG